MKKNLIIILFIAFALNVNAQKKKSSNPKSIKSNNVLAKLDNITVEINKNNLNLYVINGKINDSINVKKLNTTPTDVKLKSFSTKGNTLYLLTYSEKTLVQNPNKTEDILTTNSDVLDLISKSIIYSNVQKTTKITEKVYLDRLKNASETQEKIRNEGFLFSLLPDGDISLNSKSKSNKLTYDSATKQYIDFKKKK